MPRKTFKPMSVKEVQVAMAKKRLINAIGVARAHANCNAFEVTDAIINLIQTMAITRSTPKKDG